MNNLTFINQELIQTLKDLLGIYGDVFLHDKEVFLSTYIEMMEKEHGSKY